MDIALRGCTCTVYMCNDLIHVHVHVHVCSNVVWVQEVTKLHHNAMWVYALLFLNIYMYTCRNTCGWWKGGVMCTLLSSLVSFFR